MLCSTRSLMASTSLRSVASRPVARTTSVHAVASSAKEFVEASIAGNTVLVFSKSYCPYCTKAKKALGTVLPADKFAVFEIEDLKNCDEIQDVLLGMTGGRSVPRVFIGGKFVGGGDDTARLAGNGELKKMCEAAGAL